MENRTRSDWVRRAAFVFSTALCLAWCAAAAAQAEAESAGQWMDGVTKIVVVDESRCSTHSRDCDDGKAYVIEGAQKIAVLRKALDKLDMKLHGGCLCGGPDIHLFCLLENGGVRYLGLDCNMALRGVLITNEVRTLVNPRGSRFLGRFLGYSLIGEAPAELPAEQLMDMGDRAGYKVVTTESWREWELQRAREETAPYVMHLRAWKGPMDLELVRVLRPTYQWEQEALKAFQELIDEWGLDSSVIWKGKVTHHWEREGPDKRVLRLGLYQSLYLEDTPRVRRLVTTGLDSCGGAELVEIERRDEAQRNRAYTYTAFVVIHDLPCMSRVVEYAAMSLPALKDLRPVCDSRPGARESTGNKSR